MPHAAAYLRKSYVSVEHPGDASEEAQLEAVRRLCGAEVTVYKDWGISGATADARPDYLRLKAAIAAGEVASVCAYSLSRLGRNARELLEFVDLCERHKVTLRTAVENIDTTTAMGRAQLTIMAAFAQLEREQGSERSNVARLARQARHEQADALLPGGKLPNSIALYGFRHVPTVDASGKKIIRREPDPAHPIEPILGAYREAGTLTGAVKLLNERGVPSPKAARTGKPAQWGSSTLARVLRGHDPSILPEHGATGRQRPLGKPAMFRGLVRCHCGALMTPNTRRKQLWCSRGANKQLLAEHGRYTISENALKLALQSEVARAYRPLRPLRAKRQEEAIADLRARRGRLGALLVDDAIKGKGLISPAKVAAEVEAIDQSLERLEREQGAIVGIDQDAPIDLNGDPATTNAQLRRIWLRVDLDAQYQPHVQWVVDPDAVRAQDEAEIAKFMGMTADEVAALDQGSRDEFGMVAKLGADHDAP